MFDTVRFFEPDSNWDFWLASEQNPNIEVRWWLDARALRFSVKLWTNFLLILIGIVGMGIVSISFVVNVSKLHPSIETQLTTMLGRRVTLGVLSLSPFSASLIAKDLSVADDTNFNSATFLTAKAIRIGVLLLPLIFSHNVNLQSVQIKSRKSR